VNEENKKKIRFRIDEAAKSLEGKLPEIDKHPKGRNPHAHVPAVIKSVFGMSYTDIDDENLHLVFEVIDYCERYPF